jgi:hypothetical protein
VLQQGLRVGGVEREEAHAHAGADPQIRRSRGHGLHEYLAHAPRRLLGRAGGALDRRRQVGQQHEELVAAIAPHEIRRPRGAAQAVRHRHEHLVAHLVAEAVVHELEVVEVHVHGAHGAAVLSRPGDCLVERRAELLAVRKPGERVVIRAMAQLLLGPLPVRDVEDHALGQRAVALDRRQDDRAVQHPAHAAVR